MHRYSSQGQQQNRKTQNEDSSIKGFFQEFELGSCLKKLGIIVILYLIVIKALLVSIPPEYIITIADSKKYRIAEFVLLLLIFYLSGNQIINYFKNERPTQYKFVANRLSKDDYIRQRIRTTESELEKLQKSKEFLKWKQSQNNRENPLYKQTVLDKEDEIVFSDEDQ